MVKEIAYSLSYVPVDYLRERLGVTELKEDISIDESIFSAQGEGDHPPQTSKTLHRSMPPNR